MEALQGAVQDGGVPHEANYHYCFGAEDASRIGWLERTLRERCDVSKTCAAWADGLKRAIVVALRHRVKVVCRGEPGKVESYVIGSLWKQHVLNDHFPARRDCKTCILNSRSKAHMRITHPSAWTLSLDLTGKLKLGDDQGRKMRYGLLGTYTFPVTKQGQALVKPWDFKEVEMDEAIDHPLPDVAAELDEPVPVQEVELQEKDLEEGCANPKKEDSLGSTWERLEEETNVAIRTLTFVETIPSSTTWIEPAMGKSRLWPLILFWGLNMSGLDQRVLALKIFLKDF